MQSNWSCLRFVLNNLIFCRKDLQFPIITGDVLLVPKREVMMMIIQGIDEFGKVACQVVSIHTKWMISLCTLVNIAGSVFWMITLLYAVTQTHADISYQKSCSYLTKTLALETTHTLNDLTDEFSFSWPIDEGQNVICIISKNVVRLCRMLFVVVWHNIFRANLITFLNVWLFGLLSD